ncbi:hypothetical protein OROGR_015033 [Orobanche gracilis]
MALTTVKSIENAINLVETKKENLKRAFEELQSRSSLLSSFGFTWTDLDSYFTSLQSELLQKFPTLQTLEISQTYRPKSTKQKDRLLSDPVPARPELNSMCENMDALGLRRYIIDRPKERTAIRVELADAFKHAPDPASMVLDALKGFWDENLRSWSRLRTACTVLLEELMRAGVEIGPEVRNRAKAMAAEWKAKMVSVHSGTGDNGDEEGKEEDGGLGRLGYLQLLATYKLLDDGGYDMNELIDCVVSSARYRQAVDLCRIIGLESKISDVTLRLISKGKQLLALKFIFEFELTDEFPPVPLLEAYVMDSKRISQTVRKNGKNGRQSLNDAAMKEITALKSVIKCIEDHDLESQYSKDELVTRIERLEKEKADRKRPAPAPVAKSHQKPKPKQNGSKRIKAAPGPSAFKRRNPRNSVGAAQLRPSSLKGQGSLPDHVAPYLSAPVMSYGTVGSLVPAETYAAPSANPYGGPSANPYGGPSANPYGGPSANPYGDPSANPYGLSGIPPVFSGNPPASVPYSSEIHAQTGYYDNRVTGYGGYDVPSQYHQLYYPQ